MPFTSWLRRLFRQGAEALDPGEADPRVVAPLDRPEIIAVEVPDPPQPHAAAHPGPSARELRSEDRGQR
ncbi:MAG: hypothetical protein HS107_13440 [Thermoflexaceae bacterium]|nr:hypothetical protein [Thermoflexaceae bacterium]